MRPPSISVVLPALNEEKNLPATVALLSEALRNLDVTYEIIVVDDGSTDGTAETCRKLMQTENGLRLVSHPKTRGYGGALRTGFAHAHHELIYLTDADGQFGIDHLPSFLHKAKSADAVIGYRAGRADPGYRILFSRFGNFIARFGFGLTTRDINCAAKLLRRSRLASLALKSTGAMISTELLYRAREEGWRIVELPVNHLPRRHGRATGASPLVLALTILEFLTF